MTLTLDDINYAKAKLNGAEVPGHAALSMPGYLPWEQARVWPCLVWYPSKQQIVRFDTKEEWEQREQEPASQA